MAANRGWNFADVFIEHKKTSSYTWLQTLRCNDSRLISYRNKDAIKAYLWISGKQSEL